MICVVMYTLQSSIEYGSYNIYSYTLYIVHCAHTYNQHALRIENATQSYESNVFFTRSIKQIEKHHIHTLTE